MTAHTTWYWESYTTLAMLPTTADSVTDSTLTLSISCNTRHSQIHIRCCGGDSNRNNKKCVNTRQKGVETRKYTTPETSHISNMPHTINNVSNNNYIIILYTRGTAVAQWLRCCATNRTVAGSIPDGVTGIFHWHNPSDRTMTLGSTQPLTDMSTRSITFLPYSIQWKSSCYPATNSWHPWPISGGNMNFSLAALWNTHASLHVDHMFKTHTKKQWNG